ncbi:YigZ family protein [Fuchsiella alkaliacetigena]|uniref:YigZ family protein n=1 Tax=Fuchsiella alkaliacetigena TaxID=957042 RepID=UPI00200B1070|nr:YigZ family protein [Fuchsiella alkaliacetigena]MCK8825240.1 YigZ family protein [Fuchsiella alkaliacetigena]
MADQYQTVAKNYRIRNKIKKCKFITSIANVNTVEAAEDFIAEVSAEFADATHNVYAFKVGLGDQAVKRANDDGEPAGSSGPPILQAIEGEEITNVAIVVTRYFGGVKHGIGGLIRAYGKCGREVINAAKVIQKKRYLTVGISVPYDDLGQVINDLEGYSAQIKDTVYSNQAAEVIAALQPSIIKKCKEEISEATGGRAQFKKIKENFE